MVKKELGYVELEWECPSCGARNKGSDHDCRQCGAEMPEDVHFEIPGATRLDTTQETAEAVAAGPDILCPWCGARNPGDAEQCSQCGGPLKEGKRRDRGDVVGAYSGPVPKTSRKRTTKAVPASRPRSKKAATASSPPKAPKNRTFAIVAIAMVAAMVGFFMLMTWLSKGRDTTVAQVTSTGWETTIETEALVAVQHEGWRDEVPQGARLSECTSKVRFTHENPVPNSVERCGTPYVVDTGTGQGQVQQDCFYDEYDSWCSYEAQEWRKSTPVVLSGVGDSPSWPAMPQRADIREVSRKQVLYVRLSDGDKSYRYIPSSLGEMSEFTRGSRWEITVNAFGGVTDIQPR